MLESYWLKLKAILIITYWINQFSILKPYRLQLKTYWLKYLNAKTYWSYINNIHAARSLLLRSSFAWLPLLETSFFDTSWELCTFPPLLPRFATGGLNASKSSSSSIPSSSSKWHDRRLRQKQSLIDMIRLLSYLCHHLLPLPHLLLRPPLLRRRWDHQILHELHVFVTFSFHNFISKYVFTVVIDVILVIVVVGLFCHTSWEPSCFHRSFGLLIRFSCLNRVPKQSVQIVRIFIYCICYEKGARLQVKLHIVKLHGHECWSMMRHSLHASLVNKQLKMQYLVNMRNSCNEYLPSAWSSSPSTSPSSSWPSVHGAFVHNEAQNTIRQSWCYHCYVETQTKTIHCISKSIMVMFAGLWCDKRYHYTSLICSSIQPI